MELNELKIGQWYRPIAFPNHCYMPIKIGTDRINRAVYFIGRPDTFTEGYISNSNFWRNVDPIEIEDLPIEYQKKIPEKYKKPKEYIPQIFN